MPTAHADTNSVIEGAIVSGNVLTDGTADVFGADGATTTVPAGGVVGFAAGSDTSVAGSDRDRDADCRELRHADAERGRQLQL